MKIKSLSVMTKLCKSPTAEPLDFILLWLPLWTEAVALATRAKKTESMASETLAVNLVKSIMTFLHDARHLILSNDNEEADNAAVTDIISTAMEKMSDLRVMSSIEGVILLVNKL